jgi:transposase
LIVEETLTAGASVARVARKYGVNANQVFYWRRLYQGGQLGGEPQGGLKLLPVRVAEDAEPAKTEPAAAVSPPLAGAIHIELPGVARISLEGCVDPEVVRAVLESLRS